jgi:hypothetical protein
MNNKKRRLGVLVGSLKKINMWVKVLGVDWKHGKE